MLGLFLIGFSTILRMGINSKYPFCDNYSPLYVFLMGLKNQAHRANEDYVIQKTELKIGILYIPK
jgi:hypothetical protein